MSHEIYIFGSACRGEARPTSDVDVLVLPFDEDTSTFPSAWSVYRPELIREYYRLGRLFAWHLFLEAKCVFSTNDTPSLQSMGEPAPYSSMVEDIDDLEFLLKEALGELENGTHNKVFELGIVYTALRDIAMSASWSLTGSPCFSAFAPFHLPVDFPIEQRVYEKAMLARHSSTRGVEIEFDLDQAVEDVSSACLDRWVDELRGKL